MKKFVFVTIISLLLVLTITPVGVSASASEQTLRSLAQAKGLSIGAAVDYNPLKYDPLYSEILAREFNMLTIQNHTKFSYVHPSQDEYDFTKADFIVDFAEQNGMKVSGGSIVWWKSFPSWLTEGDWTRNELIDILKDHIKTVVGHYRGRVTAWDVVNEAFTSNGSLRDNIWLQVIGPEYIPMAFYWAHQADPNAILLYNDYGSEVLGVKSDAIYDMVKKLLKYKIPIDGIGFQMHLAVDYYDPTPEDIITNMERFVDLGLEIYFTEMTIMIYEPVTQEKLDKQAETYRNMLEACLSVDACNDFTIWGFTDLYSKFNEYDDRGWALIFDESYQAKPAYYALIEGLNPEEPPPPPEEEPSYTIDKIVEDVGGDGPSGNVNWAGDEIDYKVEVYNNGNQTLTGVSLTDTLVAGLGAPDNESMTADGNLEVGETWTWYYSYTATQADIDNNGGGDGDIDNTATIDCDQLSPLSDSEDVLIVQEEPKFPWWWYWRFRR